MDIYSSEHATLTEAGAVLYRQVMKESKGRANPAELNRLLMEALDASQ